VIDITTPAQLVVLLDLRNRAEARWVAAGGPALPIPGTNVGAGPFVAASLSQTTHHIAPHVHPSISGRRCLLLDAGHPLTVHLNAEIAACQAAVAGGTATAAQTAIANLPTAGQIDPTWNGTGLQ
jgi:hypothetical protein